MLYLWLSQGYFVVNSSQTHRRSVVDSPYVDQTIAFSMSMYDMHGSIWRQPKQYEISATSVFTKYGRDDKKRRRVQFFFLSNGIAIVARWADLYHAQGITGGNVEHGSLHIMVKVSHDSLATGIRYSHASQERRATLSKKGSCANRATITQRSCVWSYTYHTTGLRRMWKCFTWRNVLLLQKWYSLPLFEYDDNIICHIIVFIIAITRIVFDPFLCLSQEIIAILFTPDDICYWCWYNLKTHLLIYTIHKKRTQHY